MSLNLFPTASAYSGLRLGFARKIGRGSLMMPVCRKNHRPYIYHLHTFASCCRTILCLPLITCRKNNHLIQRRTHPPQRGDGVTRHPCHLYGLSRYRNNPLRSSLSRVATTVVGWDVDFAHGTLGPTFCNKAKSWTGSEETSDLL